MDRVLKYCGWKHVWWKAQILRRLPKLGGRIHKSLREGLAAYAEQQAHMENALALDWQEKWRAVRERAVPILEGNTPMELLEDDEAVGTAAMVKPIETIETIELCDDDEETDGYY